MTSEEAVQPVLPFIERINQHDVGGLCELMTEDHTFIDALGATVRGLEQLRQAWEDYFRWFPDYKITPEEILQKDDTVAIFGTAEATYALHGTLARENHWRVPAAWKAVVRDGRIAEWRVYTDNQPARALMGEKHP